MFAEFLDRIVKSCFPKQMRASLINSEVVLLLLAVQPAVNAVGALHVEDGASPCVCRWLSISCVKQKPWRFSFAEMYDRDGIRDSLTCNDPVGEVMLAHPNNIVRLYVKQVYFSTWQLPASLQFNLHWEVVVLLVHMHDELLGDFRPNCLDVKLADGRLHQVWSPCRQSKKKKDNIEDWAALGETSSDESEEGDPGDDDMPADDDDGCCTSSNDEDSDGQQDFLRTPHPGQTRTFGLGGQVFGLR